MKKPCIENFGNGKHSEKDNENGSQMKQKQ